MNTHSTSIAVTDRTRALLGFGVGLLIMLAVVQIFIVNSFDFENMQRGVRLILSGVNPWAAGTRIPHFYNPPFAILFLWPMLFTTPKVFLVIGGSLLFAFVFYHKAWVAFAWFTTNTFLWIVGCGGIDMLVIGAGLLLLLAGDRAANKWVGLLWRVLAYGFLLVKPQGGIFIVAFYLLTHRDWKGFLISTLVYGLPFLSLYPDWLSVLLNNPPLAQTVASHTLLAKFGPAPAVLIALLVMLSRRWEYWQLGGALAGILMPYGMPGLPIFLTLTGVKQIRAIPVVIIYSALLASLTWISLPPGAENANLSSNAMAIYHLGMLNLGLILACFSASSAEPHTIAIVDWIKAYRPRFKMQARTAASLSDNPSYSPD